MYHRMRQNATFFVARRRQSAFFRRSSFAIVFCVNKGKGWGGRMPHFLRRSSVVVASGAECHLFTTPLRCRGIELLFYPDFSLFAMSHNTDYVK